MRLLQMFLVKPVSLTSCLINTVLAVTESIILDLITLLLLCQFCFIRYTSGTSKLNVLFAFHLYMDIRNKFASRNCCSLLFRSFTFDSRPWKISCWTLYVVCSKGRTQFPYIKCKHEYRILMFIFSIIGSIIVILLFPTTQACKQDSWGHIR